MQSEILGRELLHGFPSSSIFWPQCLQPPEGRVIGNYSPQALSPPSYFCLRIDALLIIVLLLGPLAPWVGGVDLLQFHSHSDSLSWNGQIPNISISCAGKMLQLKEVLLLGVDWVQRATKGAGNSKLSHQFYNRRFTGGFLALPSCLVRKMKEITKISWEL